MDCKILDIQAKDGVITAAKYLCWIAEIETEGWWHFNEPGDKAFSEIQESDVIEWIKAEAGDMIETNLNRQLEALKLPKSVAPWLPQTFTPEI